MIQRLFSQTLPAALWMLGAAICLTWTVPSAAAAENVLTVSVHATGTFGSPPAISRLAPSNVDIEYDSHGQPFHLQNVTGTLTCSTAATATSGVSDSPYAITTCGGSTLADKADGLTVEFDLVSSAYVVLPTRLTITADDQPVIVYGQQLKRAMLTWHASGYQNGDSSTSLPVQPVCTSTVRLGPQRRVVSRVGEYAVNCAAPSPDGNYAPVFDSGTLMVNPAPLKIAATSSVVSFGSKLRHGQLAWRAVGLVNDDTAKDLPRKPKSCVADISRNNSGYVVSAPGVYQVYCPILTGPDGNYDVAPRAGTLSVVKAPVQFLNTPTRLSVGGTMALSAVLQSGKGIFYVDGEPLAGRVIRFQLSNPRGRIKTCTPAAPTGLLGRAGCSVRVQAWKAGKGTLAITYQGDGYFAPTVRAFAVKLTR